MLLPRLFVALALFSFNFAFSQTRGSDVPEVIITIDRISGKVKDGGKIPFDKPFTLAMELMPDEKNPDLAFIYRVTRDEKGRRVLAKTEEYLNSIGKTMDDALREDGISNIQRIEMSNLLPDLSLTPKVADNKLYLNFPALKPNTSFDIGIGFGLDESTLRAVLAVTKAVMDMKPEAEIIEMIRKLNQPLDDHSFFPTRSSFPYKSLTDFKPILPSLKSEISASADMTKISPATAIPTTLSSYVIRLSERTKVGHSQFYILSNGSGSQTGISLGLNSYLNPRKSESVSIIKFPERIANLNASISILKSIQDSLKTLHLKTGDNQVQQLSDLIGKNIDDLAGNITILKSHQKKLAEIIGPRNGKTVWIIGSTGANDLQTMGGSILSTELGLTHIGMFNNSNNFRYIPRLHWGVDIHFRPTDRNTWIKNLPKKKHVDKEDGLSAYKSPSHHWSMALGLTLGKIDVNDFDNFYNDMSLTAGPSYRFERAFRVATGLALMKRINPNPVLLDKRVAAGFFISTSIDFDLIQSIKTFTNLLFK